MAGRNHLDDMSESQVRYDILFSTADGSYQITDAKIDTSARDQQSSTPTNLRPGLVLGEIQDGSSDDGEFKHFDQSANDGTQVSRDVVILAHEVRNIDTGDKYAAVFTEAHVKEEELYNGQNVDWGNSNFILHRTTNK